MSVQINKILTADAARRYRFPDDPKPGQVIRTRDGRLWMWFPPGVFDGNLGDLGFWGALIGAASSIFGGVFGGGKDKAARQAVEEQQQQIAQLQQQVGDLYAKREGAIGKKTLMVIGFAALGLLMMFKK